MDRLVQSGVSFTESHTTDPLCSPARSSLFTSRMPSETHVIKNDMSIRPDIPTMGQWFRMSGYETVFAGKWHLPDAHPAEIPGFDLIPTGLDNNGHVGDAATSRACEGYFRNRTGHKPFLLVASVLQPHDICTWIKMRLEAPDILPYPEIEPELPPLPPNFIYDPREPNVQALNIRPSWSERQWRYYLWSYYRQIEMADSEVGRILQAVEDFGYADNTIIVFTSDHGEGRARHQLFLKNYLYEEALKVPLIVSWPGHTMAGYQDTTHLVSGLDVLPTVCDYAGINPPPLVLGSSLRPFLEGGQAPWREFIAAEATVTGRMIRTADWKYITYYGNPVEQLFDMKNDPGETANLAGLPGYDSVLQELRSLLQLWESGLDTGQGVVSLPCLEE